MSKAAASKLHIKRVYDAPEPGDGFRVLVDRLWPRGMSKDAAQVDLWAKALAPSDALRKKIHADPGFPDDLAVWSAFERAYRAEIAKAVATPDGAAALAAIETAMKKGSVTLLFGLKNEVRNHAAILRAHITS